MVARGWELSAHHNHLPDPPGSHFLTEPHTPRPFDAPTWDGYFGTADYRRLETARTLWLPNRTENVPVPDERYTIWFYACFLFYVVCSNIWQNSLPNPHKDISVLRNEILPSQKRSEKVKFARYFTFEGSYCTLSSKLFSNTLSLQFSKYRMYVSEVYIYSYFLFRYIFLLSGSSVFMGCGWRRRYPHTRLLIYRIRSRQQPKKFNPLRYC